MDAIDCCRKRINVLSRVTPEVRSLRIPPSDDAVAVIDWPFSYDS